MPLEDKVSGVKGLFSRGKRLISSGLALGTLLLTVGCPWDSSSSSASKKGGNRTKVYENSVGVWVPPEVDESFVDEVGEELRKKLAKEATSKVLESGVGSAAGPLTSMVSFIKDLPSVNGAPPKYDVVVRRLDDKKWHNKIRLHKNEEILIGLAYYPGFSSSVGYEGPHVNGLEVVVNDVMGMGHGQKLDNVTILRQGEETDSGMPDKNGVVKVPNFFVVKKPYSFEKFMQDKRGRRGMGKDFNISVLGDSVNVHVMNKELRKNKKSAGSQGFVFFVQEPRRGSSQAFIVDPETSDTIQLTDTKGEGGRFQNFMLAPETNTLFFGNNGSAFSIGLEDSNLTSLGFGFGTYDSYFFASPDGSRFVSSGAGGRLRSFDNGEVIRKIQSKPPGGIINECDFSPDGSKLAFRSAPGRSYVIHIADLESGTVEHLTSSHQSNTFPKWSPDGKKIAYISAPNDRRSDIWVSDVDTRDATKLTNVGPVFSFSWSPDGKKIVLDHGRKSDDYREIYVVDVDSGNLNRLTTNQELDEYPTFSPEGSRIAYASWVDGVPEVYVMDVDGKNKKRLTYTDKSRKRQLHWVDTH